MSSTEWNGMVASTDCGSDYLMRRFSKGTLTDPIHFCPTLYLSFPFLNVSRCQICIHIIVTASNGSKMLRTQIKMLTEKSSFLDNHHAPCLAKFSLITNLARCKIQWILVVSSHGLQKQDLFFWIKVPWDKQILLIASIFLELNSDDSGIYTQRHNNWFFSEITIPVFKSSLLLHSCEW